MSARLDALLAEKARRQENMQPSAAGTNPRLEALLAEKAKRQETIQQKPEFNTARFIGEQLTKGAINLADILPFFNQFNATIPNPHGGAAERIYPSLEKEILPAVGIDINSQPEDTGAKRIAGHALRMAPQALLSPSNLVRGATMGAATGAGSGALQEVGVPELAADIISGVATPGVPLAARAMRRAPSTLSSKEREIAKYLQQAAGPEETAKIAERLSKTPKYTSGYEPTTAEVGQSPSLSAMQRAEYGVPGSGIPEFTGKSAEKLQGSFAKAMREPDIGTIGEEARGAIEKGVKGLKAERRAPTKPLYEEVKQLQNEVTPSNLKKFFKENKDVAGDLESDVNRIKKMIKPQEKLKPSQIAEQRTYLEHMSEAKKRGPKVLEAFLKQTPRPEGLEPTIARLAEAKKAINSRAQKYKRSGEDNRLRLMREAGEAIEKDLEHIPQQREANRLYRELSEPISEVMEQPSLKKVLKKTDKHYNVGSQKVIKTIFDERSHENIKSLKKALHKSPEVQEKLAEGSINHFYNSITNAGLEGQAQKLSYPKMKNFLKQHHKALGEILTPEQAGLINETKNIVQGQHAVASLGVEPGSPTASRIRSHFNFSNKTSPKTYLVKVGQKTPFLGKLFENYAEKHADEMSTILHKALLDKELAHKMYTYNFKSQADFNKFMNDVARLEVAAEKNRKEKEED